MSAEKCPSGLYDLCNMYKYCVPVVRDVPEEAVDRLRDQGFHVMSYTGEADDNSVVTCSAILRPEHTTRLAQLTGELPDVTERDIRLGAESFGVLAVHEEARYQDRLAVDRALGFA